MQQQKAHHRVNDDRGDARLNKIAQWFYTCFTQRSLKPVYLSMWSAINWRVVTKNQLTLFAPSVFLPSRSRQ